MLICVSQISIFQSSSFILKSSASGPGDQQEVTVNQNTAKMTNEDQPRHPTTDRGSFVIFNEARSVSVEKPIIRRQIGLIGSKKPFGFIELLY